jgi:hypothetical protein
MLEPFKLVMLAPLPLILAVTARSPVTVIMVPPPFWVMMLSPTAVLPVNKATVLTVPLPPTPVAGQLPVDRHIVPEASGTVIVRLAVGVAKPRLDVKLPLVAVTTVLALPCRVSV